MYVSIYLSIQIIISYVIISSKPQKLGINYLGGSAAQCDIYFMLYNNCLLNTKKISLKISFIIVHSRIKHTI